jgi:Uma2 family endonuclease
MGNALPLPRTTAQAYLDWEAQQPDKHEFVAGEIYAMVGARRVHVVIAGNCFFQLKNFLRGTPCRAFAADMKLRVEAADAYFYPDIMVCCDPGDLAADIAMAHPRAIIEILSESTAAYDRGAKFGSYRLLPSLEEYVLIDPDTRSIDVFRRLPDGNWLLAASEHEGLRIRCLDFFASAAAVFEDVDGVASETGTQS